jgi:hypothetical protein
MAGRLVNDVSERDRPWDNSRNCPDFFYKDWAKIRKILDMRAGIVSEIRTGHLPTQIKIVTAWNNMLFIFVTFWRKTSYISVHIGGSPRRSRCQTFALFTFLHSAPRLLRLEQWTIHSLKGKEYAYTLKKWSSKNLEICQNGGHVKITYDFHTLTI